MAILVQSSENDVLISYRIVDAELYRKIQSQHRSKLETVDDIERPKLLGEEESGKT